MNKILPLALACISIVMLSCNEDEQVLPVQPQPTSGTAKADSAKVTTTSTTTSTTSASKPANQFVYKDSAYYQSSTVEGLPVRVLTPRKFNTSSKYPLVIFLHGIDERGTDNEKQLRWGASMFLSDSATSNYPSFVVFPQCPATNKWVDEPVQTMLRKMIDKLLATCNIDPSRIYIVGLSMGAFGTYATVGNNPGLFAGAVAISGAGDENKCTAMAMTNWKIFGGKKDQIVPSEESERMASALKAHGAKVSLTIYADADHVHSWTKAFAEPDFLSWLYSNKK